MKFFDKDLEHSCWLVIVEVRNVEQYMAVRVRLHFGGLAFCPGVGGLLPNKPEDLAPKAKAFLIQHLYQAKCMFFCDFVYFSL